MSSSSAGGSPGAPWDHALPFRHPRAGTALAEAAADAGAEIITGVGPVTVQPGPRPTVTFEHGDATKQIECRLIAGADGRNSAVRKQARIPLHAEAGNHHIDGLKTAPMDAVTVGIGGVAFSLSFPQGNGWSRIYSAPSVSEKGRYSGTDRDRRFLRDVAMPFFLWRDEIAEATPQGPCRTCTGDDTWVDDPAEKGLLLIGDAAGYDESDHRLRSGERLTRRSRRRRGADDVEGLDARRVRAIRRRASGAHAASAVQRADGGRAVGR